MQQLVIIVDSAWIRHPEPRKNPCSSLLLHLLWYKKAVCSVYYVAKVK